MARRSGRPGSWLATSDYTGITYYAEQLQRDYWGNYDIHPLKRNLQEIASPLNDPQPVPFYRGPNYEILPPCVAEVAPVYVGNTNVPTNTDNAAFYALDLDPSIGQMIIGCTFVVR